MDKNNRVALFFLVLGVIVAIAGFVCLLVALAGLGAAFLVLIIVGGVMAGVGFLTALIAAFFFEFQDEDNSYGVIQEDDEKKKKRPYFGAMPTFPTSKKKKNPAVPPLSPASKDHIYRMTLNLGSVDVRSQPESAPLDKDDETVYVDPTSLNAPKTFKD